MTALTVEEGREANRIVAAFGSVHPAVNPCNGGDGLDYGRWPALRGPYYYASEGSWAREIEDERRRQPRCRETTSNGYGCSISPLPGGDYCYRHAEPARFWRTQPPELVEPIYFVEGAGLVKIGKGPRKRAASHQTSSPVPLTILRCLTTVEGGEYQLHKIYERERVRGEWFRLSRRLRRLIFTKSDEQITRGISLARGGPAARWYRDLANWERNPANCEHPLRTFARAEREVARAEASRRRANAV